MLTEQKREKQAMSISLYGNVAFVIIEIVMAVWTGSQAVLLDAVYDGVEFVMLLPSIFLIPLLYKPLTEQRPFGYMQFETVFVLIKGIAMTAVTVGLILNNLNIMLNGGHIISFGLVAYFELFAAVLGFTVSIYLSKKNDALNSPLIEMELESWRIDCVASLGMAVAFFSPKFITAEGFAAFIPYLDQVITIVLSLFMIPVPLKMVVHALRDLILMPPEEELTEQIKNCVYETIKGDRYSDVYFDIVRTGRKIWISVYITFKDDKVSLKRFGKMQSECIMALEEVLADTYPDFYIELLPNIDIHEPEEVEEYETE